MPLKEGIVELRQKGASFRLIRELLATVGAAIGADTIARFFAEVIGQPPAATIIETTDTPTSYCRERDPTCGHGLAGLLKCPPILDGEKT